MDLSDGDWIEVKRELNVGEARRIAERSSRAVTDPETGKSIVEADLNQLAVLETYITNWSFVDKRGVQTKPSAASIKAIDQNTFLEIVLALSKHVATVREAQESDPTEAAPNPISA
ncbi:MAG: hypothetical protein PHR30_16485 [Gallionellaceae bacterium]|nr:hypothetical protein [Gallionellaceae bacterium]